MRIRTELPSEVLPLDNPGLLLQKNFPIGPFFDAQGRLLTGETEKRKRTEAQTKFLAQLVGAAGPPLYVAALQEFRQAVDRPNAISFEAVLKSRLTSGLGAASPNENGLSLNHTFGLPLIPGSSIKGAMRARAQELLGLTDIPPDTETRLHPEARPLFDTFGSQENMSAITVFDAWLVPSKGPFVREAWTPHHQKYMNGDYKLPLETEDPLPIHLLAVPAGAKFFFAVLVPSEEWKPVIRDLLVQTLASGLGAKRNQGYGRFGIAA